MKDYEYERERGGGEGEYLVARPFAGRGTSRVKKMLWAAAVVFGLALMFGMGAFAANCST